MPSLDGVGKLKTAPAQIVDTCVKVGVTFGVTVTLIVVVTAHCPADGVNVYVVVAVVFTAGDQVPVIPSIDVVGKIKLAPSQIAAIGLKVGVTIGFTTIVIAAVVAHRPASGVNV
jgi:hypothetical protein